MTVSASNILAKVAERKKQPGITAKELAEYANELLETRGFDYNFEVCDLLSDKDRKSTAESFSKHYRTSLSDGPKVTLNFPVSNPADGLCGECWAIIPSRKVTKSEIELISDGERNRIRRTSAFHLDEVQLVDATLKKVLRSWEFPEQAVPIGISADGTKVYLDVYDQERIDELVLEVSEDGTLAYRDRAALGLTEGKWIEDFPRDPRNSYLSYVKFQSGNQTYIVRFTAPCT